MFVIFRGSVCELGGASIVHWQVVWGSMVEGGVTPMSLNSTGMAGRACHPPWGLLSWASPVMAEAREEVAKP